MHSHAIRLRFNTSDHAIDYEALLAGLAASVSKGLATIKLEFLNQEVSVGIKQDHRWRRQAATRREKRAGGMTQDPLDGQQHIYSQFAPSSEQQVFSGIPRAPPLTENGL
ncbi:hypothetical protein Tco_0133259 [Tanacetum coccineum]